MVFWINLLNLKKRFGSQRGFTVIELLVVITITGILTAVITVNFQSLRQEQDLNVAINETISRLREVQNFVLSGRVVPGQGTPAQSYEIVFVPDSQTYTINYTIDGSPGSPEVVNLTRDVKVDQVFLNGFSVASVNIMLNSPYANTSINGSSTDIAEIVLLHTRNGRANSIFIDANSGRITRD